MLIKIWYSNTITIIFFMKRLSQEKLSLTWKSVEPENQEDGLDKDGEAGEPLKLKDQWPQAQQLTLRENSSDSLENVSCSKFQYHSSTQTIFEWTQFKMSCGTYMYDPLWLISRLNTVSLILIVKHNPENKINFLHD